MGSGLESLIFGMWMVGVGWSIKGIGCGLWMGDGWYGDVMQDGSAVQVDTVEAGTAAELGRLADEGGAAALPTAAVVLLALAIGFMPIPYDPDLWFHLADGRWIVRQWDVPQVDVFSFTRSGKLWVPHSWLFDVGVYLSWSRLGPRAAEGLMAVVFAGAMVLAYRLMVRRGVMAVYAAGVVLGLAIAAGNTRGLRPQVWSLFLAMVVIDLLVRHRDRPGWRLVGWTAGVFLLWAQVHSACVMGLGVMGLWLAGRVVERVWGGNATCREAAVLAVSVAAALAAILVTPHAMDHVDYVRMTMGLEELKLTEEWRVPAIWPVQAPDIYMYLLAAAVAWAVVRRWRRIGWAELTLCGGLLVLGFSGVRHIPLACMGSAPLFAAALGREAVDAGKAETLTVRFAVTVGVLAAVVLALLCRYPTDVWTRYASREPIRGVAALLELDRPVRLFTTMNTGSYVTFAADGRLAVFADSRCDVYGDEILRAARLAMGGREWEGTFARWGIDAAVVDAWCPLARILEADGGWRVLAKEPGAVTFVRAGRAE